jgi:nucleotide-binding universal stress UspA family protein
MYRRILAAVNEHLNSEVAAGYALRLARVCDAHFSLCFVASQDTPRPAFDRAQEAMRRLFVEAEKIGVKVESIIATGDAVKEIAAIVRNERTDIVFAATRREDVQRRFYAGTVARSLSLKLPCSVALVRVVHMGKIRPSKILVPVKARINRVRERAWFAAKMAESFGAKIIVFHAPKPIMGFFHGEIYLAPSEWEKRMPKDISAFTEYVKNHKIEFEGLLTPGVPSRAISIEAAAQRHDLIIMGASERSMVTSLLRGSPVEAVLRETPCDLIILSPRHEDQ